MLIPSWFGHRLPLLDPHAEPQPFLTYPAHREAVGARPDGASTGASAAALGALLGRTRAAVLLTIADRTGCTTTEIARRVGISAASASEHTSVSGRPNSSQRPVTATPPCTRQHPRPWPSSDPEAKALDYAVLLTEAVATSGRVHLPAPVPRE